MSTQTRFPLSATQRRLWFVQRLDPDDPSYNVPLAIQIKGPLNVDLLENSLQCLVDRHAVLRTSIHEERGEPYQLISDSLQAKIDLIDMSDIEDTLCDEKSSRFGYDQAMRAFDLTQVPLFRAYLIKLGEDVYRLYFILHHIITDGASRRMMYAELAEAYSALAENRPAELPILASQYHDFSVWQQGQSESEAWTEQLAFWRENLEEEVPRLRLSPRPVNERADDVGFQRITLEVPLVDQLSAVAKSRRVTLFVILLAAFKLLIQRRSGESKICVGVPSAGRSRSDVEQLLGFFINTLPFKTDLSTIGTFDELAQAVNETKFSALVNQDVPFEKIVEELNPTRALDQTPFFDILINYLPWKPKELAFGKATSAVLPINEHQPKFHLTVYMRQVSEGMDLEFVYRPAFISHDSATALSQQYLHLLKQIGADPNKALVDYDLVPASHRRLLPDPAKPIVEQEFLSVPAAIAKVAAEMPGRTAISNGVNTWSYKDVGDRAQRIADALAHAELAKGDVVAIRCHRDHDLIASILGTLFRGGVMLLLDDELPRQLALDMCAAASVKSLIVAGSLGDQDFWNDIVPPDRIINVEELPDGVSDSWSALESVSVHANDAAYIFFTSGTTGSPKGILGSHKGLSHFLEWQRERFSIGPDDRCPFTSALSFDPLLREVLLPLTTGATLMLPPEDVRRSASMLAWLDDQRATILNTVPSLANAWLQEVRRGVDLETMRWVFLSGEPLTDSLVTAWRDRFPASGPIVNLYGPTESTMVKSFHIPQKTMEPGIQAIGSALPQTDLLVLAEDDSICGIEQPGEIVIRSPYIAKGYLNQGAKERSAFTSNPHTGATNDLVYRTGDVGYYNTEGTLHWIGRKDFQEKVRGVRVEPEGVSAAIEQYPGVRRCFTLVVTKPGDEAFLASYVESNAALSREEIRSFLSDRLLPASIPDVVMFVDALPLTRHGKVDRSQLPSVDRVQPDAQAYQAPADDVEVAIARTWADVLSLERVGVADNFFDLGGHSLAAMRILARANEHFGKSVGLRSFFDAQTVFDQANLFRS